MSTSIPLIIDNDDLQASTTRVRDLIDAARIRHWSFANTVLGSGAATLFLNQRQRTHLAAHGAAIEGLVGSAYEFALAASGARFVALLDGVPTFTDSYEDGWPVHLEDGIVPYIDLTEPRIAGDPFGTNGGAAGFPLPTDMVRLIAVTAVYGSEGRLLPVDIIPERDQAKRLPGRTLTGFLSGNRFVPVYPLATGLGTSGDRWTAVTALRVSYVGIQTFQTLDDVVMLPSVLCEALTADLAVLFAQQAPKCPPAALAAFERAAASALGAVMAAGSDMVDSVTSGRVILKR